MNKVLHSLLLLLPLSTLTMDQPSQRKIALPRDPHAEVYNKVRAIWQQAKKSLEEQKPWHGPYQIGVDAQGNPVYKVWQMPQEYYYFVTALENLHRTSSRRTLYNLTQHVPYNNWIRPIAQYTLGLLEAVLGHRRNAAFHFSDLYKNIYWVPDFYRATDLDTALKHEYETITQRPLTSKRKKSPTRPNNPAKPKSDA